MGGKQAFLPWGSSRWKPDSSRGVCLSPWWPPHSLGDRTGAAATQEFCFRSFASTRLAPHALKQVASELPCSFELALDLAWATGHRAGAILALRWDDIDFEATESAPYGAIRWRAENDKTGNEHTIPMNSLAREALTNARGERPGIGEAWVFPSPRDPSRHMDRHLLGRWLRKAERIAELEHERGGGWHAFRRGWATARKRFPLKDVAEAGGSSSKRAASSAG
jgi:integrase